MLEWVVQCLEMLSEINGKIAEETGWGDKYYGKNKVKAKRQIYCV